MEKWLNNAKKIPFTEFYCIKHFKYFTFLSHFNINEYKPKSKRNNFRTELISQALQLFFRTLNSEIVCHLLSNFKLLTVSKFFANSYNCSTFIHLWEQWNWNFKVNQYSDSLCFFSVFFREAMTPQNHSKELNLIQLLLVVCYIDYEDSRATKVIN